MGFNAKQLLVMGGLLTEGGFEGGSFNMIIRMHPEEPVTSAILVDTEYDTVHVRELQSR
jgi:hypothetical protein